MGKKRNGDWFTEPPKNIEQQVSCPKCSTAMTPEAVLCMHCGFNQLTSEYVDLPGNSSAKRNVGKNRKRTLSLLFSTALVASSIFGAYIYLFYESFMLEHRNKLPRKMAYQLPEMINRPINSKWMKDLKYESINKAFENMVEREMDADYPLFKFDENISLKLAGNKSQSGQYKSSTSTAIVLDNGNEIIEIPYESLNIKCRVRCDRNERKILIDKVGHQRAVTFLMGAKEQPQSKFTNLGGTHTSPMLGKQEGGSNNKGLSKPR